MYRRKHRYIWCGNEQVKEGFSTLGGTAPGIYSVGAHETHFYLIGGSLSIRRADNGPINGVGVSCRPSCFKATVVLSRLLFLLTENVLPA
jgi:hypothetical protein